MLFRENPAGFIKNILIKSLREHKDIVTTNLELPILKYW